MWTVIVTNLLKPVLCNTFICLITEQICEQASNTLHHINIAKLFMKTLPWLGSGISLGVGAQLTPKIYWSAPGTPKALWIASDPNHLTHLYYKLLEGVLSSVTINNQQFVTDKLWYMPQNIWIHGIFVLGIKYFTVIEIKHETW